MWACVCLLEVRVAKCEWDVERRVRSSWEGGLGLGGWEMVRSGRYSLRILLAMGSWGKGCGWVAGLKPEGRRGWQTSTCTGAEPGQHLLPIQGASVSLLPSAQALWCFQRRCRPSGAIPQRRWGFPERWFSSSRKPPVQQSLSRRR